MLCEDSKESGQSPAGLTESKNTRNRKDEKSRNKRKEGFHLDAFHRTHVLCLNTNTSKSLVSPQTLPRRRSTFSAMPAHLQDVTLRHCGPDLNCTVPLPAPDISLKVSFLEKQYTQYRVYFFWTGVFFLVFYNYFTPDHKGCFILFINSSIYI